MNRRFAFLCYNIKSKQRKYDDDQINEIFEKLENANAIVMGAPDEGIVRTLSI